MRNTAFTILFSCLLFFGISSFAHAAVPAPDWLLQFNGDYTNATGNDDYDGIKTGPESIVTDGTRGQVFISNGQNKSGGGSYLTINQPYNQGTSFTKAAWVYADADAGTGGRNIISHLGQFGTGGNPAAFYYSTYFWIFQSKLGAGHFLNGNGALAQVAVDSTNLPTGTWVHTAVTYDQADKRFRLYRNGVLVANNTTTVHPVYSPIVQVGAFGENFVWKGIIDDAQMWTGVALDASQIAEVYAGDTGLVPTAPRAATGLTATADTATSMDLSWRAAPANGSAVTDYIIEYRPNTGGAWTTFTDAVSSATTATVTGLTTGVKYQFRVSAVNGVGTGPVSDYTVGTPGESEKVYYVLSTGQSLAMGYNSSVALSTYQPYENLMFNPGVEATTTPLIPLYESGQGERGNVETPSSGVVNSLSAYIYNEFPFALGLHGKSGTAYSGLKQGTAQYNLGITQVTNAKTYLDGQGKTLIPIAITSAHGESDYYAGLASTYAANLAEWQSNYEDDVNAVTGRTDSIPLFINQMNSAAFGDIAAAQLDAHRNNPGKVILVGPKYQYAYASDHLHLTSTNSRHSGEMFAKVINKVVFEGETWNPLMPTSVNRVGNIVTIDYDIPEGTLAIDTSNVAARMNYGFEFSETGGSGTTISSVELIEGNTKVKITLSGTPTGTNQRIKYAWTCPLGTGVDCGGSASASYVGGNIRDTDSSVSLAPDSTGLPLYNWSVAFSEPITYDETAPVRSAGSPSGSLAYSSNTTLSVTTNENATCAYSTAADTAYGSMTAFTTTGTTSHSVSITGLERSRVYDYYVRCQDGLGNTNTDDYVISFTTTAGASAGAVPISVLQKERPVLIPGTLVVSKREGNTVTVLVGLNSTIASMIVGKDSEYKDSSRVFPTESLVFDTSKTQKIYVKFCDSTGACSSDVVLNLLSNAQPTLSFKGMIGRGAKGDAVRVLQQLLSRDPEIYPLGRVTGTFGPATRIAVQKFQQKYGIVTNSKSPAYGYVGPRTTAKINEVLNK